jgi:hypothetical protein
VPVRLDEETGFVPDPLRFEKAIRPKPPFSIAVLPGMAQRAFTFSGASVQFHCDHLNNIT